MKAVCPVGCVTHIKEPSALSYQIDTYIRGSPCVPGLIGSILCHSNLVNNYMVICKRSRYHNSNVVPYTLKENTV